MLVAVIRPPGNCRSMPLPSPDLFARTLATSNVSSLSCARRAMATAPTAHRVMNSFRIKGSRDYRRLSAAGLFHLFAAELAVDAGLKEAALRFGVHQRPIGELRHIVILIQAARREFELQESTIGVVADGFQRARLNR